VLLGEREQLDERVLLIAALNFVKSAETPPMEVGLPNDGVCFDSPGEPSFSYCRSPDYSK
jgi:hypothetical protein